MLDSKFKLQTMELGFPSIVISRNGIFLSKNFYKKICETSHVQIYLSEETKELAIVPCSVLDESSIELKVVGESARIYNKDFINRLASLIQKSYDTINVRVPGKNTDGYYIFDLTKAVERKKTDDKEV